MNHLLVSLRLTLVLLVITCGIYPLAVWAIGQAAFPDQANGSLIVRDKKIIGSSLIGQDFTGERFFHPRPRASSRMRSSGDLATTTKGTLFLAWGAVPFRPSRMDVHDVQGDFIFELNM